MRLLWAHAHCGTRHARAHLVPGPSTASPATRHPVTALDLRLVLVLVLFLVLVPRRVHGADHGPGRRSCARIIPPAIRRASP